MSRQVDIKCLCGAQWEGRSRKLNDSEYDKYGLEYAISVRHRNGKVPEVGDTVKTFFPRNKSQLSTILEILERQGSGRSGLSLCYIGPIYNRSYSHGNHDDHDDHDS